MEFNKYNYYSVLSQQECSKNENAEKIIEKFDKLKNIHTTKEAREYLRNTWSIEGGKEVYILNDSAEIKLIEDEENFCIILSCSDKNVIHSYKK